MIPSIITRGCNLLGQRSAVAALVRELVPFRCSGCRNLSKRPGRSRGAFATAYFWLGSLLLLVVCFGLLTNDSADAERTSDALGSAGFWLIVVPCLSFAAIGLVCAPEISGPVLAVNLWLFCFIAWQLIKWALIICTLGLLWSGLKNLINERRRQ